MNVVDSCGWLEYFADGPNADFFASAIQRTRSLLVPSICIMEVFKRVLQQRGDAKEVDGEGVRASRRVTLRKAECRMMKWSDPPRLASSFQCVQQVLQVVNRKQQPAAVPGEHFAIHEVYGHAGKLLGKR